MRFYKELLNRRIPQLLASYFIAGATFILFMDWLFDEKTKSIHDDMKYYMEVIEVQDSIAYAKIIGSLYPVFKVRENDMVFISK